MSASAMKTFVRDLFKETEDYKSLTQRIIRDRYMKHINVDALAEGDRALLRESVEFVVKEMIENSADDVQQENIAENDRSSNTGDRTKQNKNTNEKSVKCCSDLEEDDVKVTKRGKKNRITDDSDSDGSSEESKRESSKSNENVASSNDDEDSHSESQLGKRKQPKVSELAPKKIKLSDSSNNTKKPTKKEAVSRKMPSDGSDSETSSIEEKRSNISEKSKPVAKALISSSKKLTKKQKLSSSEDEALENEEDNIVNKKINEGSDSDESEPLQTYRDKDKKEKANLNNSKKVVNKKKQLKSDEENSSSESDDQALADVAKSSPEQLSATDSSDHSDIIAISTSKSKKKLAGKSCGVKEEKKKFKGKRQSSSKKPTNEVGDKDEAVKKLEKIARACGALPVGKHYKLAFENCRNNKERAKKLKQMLIDAGLTGTFTMKSVETLKLKREAAELLCESSRISGSIMSEGRGRRSASNSKDMSTPKAATIDSAKRSFSRLKGIVDSEEESD